MGRTRSGIRSLALISVLILTSCTGVLQLIDGSAPQPVEPVQPKLFVVPLMVTVLNDGQVKVSAEPDLARKQPNSSPQGSWAPQQATGLDHGRLLIVMIDGSVAQYFHLDSTQAFGLGYLGNAAKYREVNRTITYNGSMILELETVRPRDEDVVFKLGDPFQLGTFGASLGQCADLAFQSPVDSAPLDVRLIVQHVEITGTVSINDHVLATIPTTDFTEAQQTVEFSALTLTDRLNTLTICAGITTDSSDPLMARMNPPLISGVTVQDLTIKKQGQQ